MDTVASCTKLYDSRASVFEVDPDTKSSWIQKGKSAIPIAFVASIVDQQPDQNHEVAQSRRELKIIGTNETGETVLDAIILPETTFMKRAKKFGQWIDHTGTVYGLGFNSEAELTDFGDTFQKLQRQILSPTSTNQPSPNNNATSINDQQQQQPSQQQQHQQQQQSLQPQRASSQNDKPAWYQHNLTTNNTSETNGRHGTSSGRASTASSTQQFSSNTLAHPGHQIKRQPLQAPSSRPVNGDSNLNNSANDNGSTGLSNVTAYPRSHSLYGLQSGRVSLTNNSAGKFTPDDQHSPESQNDWQIRDQLKYENERLKQALEESSKNAGIWHNELLNLRTNNVKLTQALQESKAHVEQWERELLSLRDENKQLVLRLKALESVSDPEKANDYKKEVQQYKSYMEQVQDELRKKESEIQDLQKSMEELELKRTYSSNGHHQHEDVPTQKLDLINAKLEAKVNELVNVQREFSQLIDKLHH